jgi:hypothetical protein
MKRFFKDVWCVLFHQRYHFRSTYLETSVLCQKCDAELISLVIKSHG